MPLVVVGLNHQTSPVEVRERFAFTEKELPDILNLLRQSGLASECVIVSTCNRVEAYAAIERDAAVAARELRDFLIENRNCPPDTRNQFYHHSSPRSLEHLFRVVCGLDSLVLGETEILGQIKRAYDLALQAGCTGPTLNKSFQTAFRVAKLVRTQTNIQRGSTSVGSVAVELAEKLFADLKECDVMVLGAGDTSEKTARALQSRGARSLIVSNRSFERAQSLARELGGEALHFDAWESVFHRINIIISSTSAPHYVLDRLKLEKLMRLRKSRPLMLIDIAVPRDIDPKVEQLENVYLYDIDDLQMIADDSILQRKQEIARCENIIRERATQFEQQHAPSSSSSLSRPLFPGHTRPSAS